MCASEQTMPANPPHAVRMTSSETFPANEASLGHLPYVADRMKCARLASKTKRSACNAAAKFRNARDL